MKLPLLNIDGSKNSSIEISDKLVKLKINHKLIKFVIDWQLNHLKPRTAKTKQRNQIRGSTKKIIAQKGSGGARHASKKAPLFVGGGVAHGLLDELRLHVEVFELPLELVHVVAHRLEVHVFQGLIQGLYDAGHVLVHHVHLRLRLKARHDPV